MFSMKKACCVILAALMLDTAACAEGASFTVAPADGSEIPASGQAEIHDLRVSDRSFGAYHVATVTWEAGGETFEWVNGGLDRALTEDEARTAAACFRSGRSFTLEGAGLVDAEKASNKLPAAEGTPLAGADAVRADDSWGDSKQCWAGSLSDMLQVTGWGAKAVSPVTGEAFSSEDELFSYFTACFSNGGNYQLDGAAWFFDGTYERDVGMAVLRDETSGGLLKDRPFPVSKLTGGETGETYAEQIGAMFLKLAEGACVGLDVQMYETAYPLRGNAEQTASLDYDSGTYRWSELHFCEEGDVLQELPFVLDSTESVVLVTDAGDGQYKDAEGAAYPAEQVMLGQFASYEGKLYPTTTEENDDTDRTFTIVRTASPDELQLDAAETSYVGSHALTAIGYIRCVSGSRPGLRALMIADSDNSAHCYSPVGGQVLKQDRPNIYTLYFTEDYPQDEYDTIALSDYIGRKAAISGATLMTAAE